MEQKPLLLGGQWRATRSAREVRSPYDGELIASFSVADRSGRAVCNQKSKI